MMATAISKADARRILSAHETWDVTNHYITLETHTCHGTRRRTISKVNTASFGWVLDGRDERLSFSRFTFAQDDDGVLEVYGHPAAGDLFLTMAPVQSEHCAAQTERCAQWTQFDEVPMFDVPAEGELFDCRPFESDGPAPGGRDLPASSWRCPACGEGNEVSPGATCARCEQAGHEALTMEVDE